MTTFEEDETVSRRWLRSTSQENESGIEEELSVWKNVELQSLPVYSTFTNQIYFIDIERSSWDMAYQLYYDYAVEEYWHGHFRSERKTNYG